MRGVVTLIAPSHTETGQLPPTFSPDSCAAQATSRRWPESDRLSYQQNGRLDSVAKAWQTHPVSTEEKQAAGAPSIRRVPKPPKPVPSQATGFRQERLNNNAAAKAAAAKK
jgi:hypothetical protein